MAVGRGVECAGNTMEGLLLVRALGHTEESRSDTTTKRIKRNDDRQLGQESKERESMGISTKHVTIKGAGGCESSLD